MKQTIIAFDEGYRQIEDILKRHASRRFLLVCGNSFKGLRISEYFNTLTTPCTVFTGFTSNPKSEQIENGLDAFRSYSCDSIIAVGGGSAIDVAKCIRLYSGMDNVVLIAVPTTAGTGSESTSFAVAYKNGTKHSIITGLPDYAILDESVLENLPIYQKKTTMYDALCQGIESMWSKLATEESRKHAKIAIELIIENYQEYLENAKPPRVVLQKMMLASNYSGQAINISKTTAAHAMSYGLTSMFDLPHGYAVALCLVPYWRFLNTKLDLANFDIPIDVAFIEALLKKYPISANSNCSYEQIQKLSKTVNIERLQNSPVPLSNEDIASFYKVIVGNIVESTKKISD